MARGGRRTGLVAALLAVALAGACSYDSREPGLFDGPHATTTPEVPAARPNLALPVLGEAVWTSADGLSVTVRLAVHAVRRLPDATILDWSVTPLSAPGLLPGDAVPPSVELGLARLGEDSADIVLLDPAHRVYRPLTRKATGVPQCLCTQLRLVQLGLVLGQTRVLQMAFAALPAAVSAVDVDIATVPVFASVPVTPLNRYPRAVRQVDLGRPAEPRTPAARSDPFHYGPAGQDLTLTVDRIVAGPHVTSIAWTIEPLGAGRGLADATEPPIGDAAAPDDSVNRLVAGGPQLIVGDRTWHAMQIRTSAFGRAASECLCTDLRSWPTAAARPGGRVQVVTNLPPLPAGTSRVTVLLPGAAVIPDVPVVPAVEAWTVPVVLVSGFPKRWTVRPNRPASGWSALAWPTPVPSAADLTRYAGTVERLG